MADHGGVAHHKRPRRRAGLRSGLWAAAAALLGLASGGLPIVRALELRTLDTRFRMFAEPETARKDIVIVDINEDSLRALRDLPEYGRWPWGRGAHANLVDVLKHAGARWIVFDILFDMPEPKDPEGDAAFVRSVAEAGNVILAAAFPPDRLPSGDLDLARFALPASAAPEDPFVVRGALVPFKKLRDVAAGIGAINIDPKGTIHRVPTTVSYEGGLYPSLALRAALAEGAELEPRVIRHQRGTTPLADNGEVLVTWRGPMGTYTYVEAEDLIRAYRALAQGEDAPSWLEILRGKTVLVGTTLAAAYEWRVTPVDELMAGVEVQAAALDTLTTADPVTAAAPVLAWMLVLLLAAGAGFAAGATPTLPVILGAFGLAAAVDIVLAGWLFAVNHTWFPVGAPVVALGAGLVAVISDHYLVAGRRRRELQRMFGAYVSQDVLNELLADPARVALGGVRREVTVMFSDIRGFTATSEKLPPEEVMEALNQYLARMAGIILERGGTVDKYIGDGIMAFFGAPVDYSDHAERAVAAGLDMLDNSVSISSPRNMA